MQAWNLPAAKLAAGFSFAIRLIRLLITPISSPASFVVFDMEHTGWSLETAHMLLSTARAASLVSLVRRSADFGVAPDDYASGIRLTTITVATTGGCSAPRSRRTRA
jgi:hypothetical protein